MPKCATTLLLAALVAFFFSAHTYCAAIEVSAAAAEAVAEVAEVFAGVADVVYVAEVAIPDVPVADVPGADVPGADVDGATDCAADFAAGA